MTRLSSAPSRRRRLPLRAAALVVATSLPTLAHAQQPSATGGPALRPLSIEDAFRLAETASEPVRISEAALLRARGQVKQARSTVLPQVTATAGIQRLLQNQFDAITRRFADPNAPPPVDTGGQQTNPIQLLFASPNTWTVSLQASQPLFLDRRLTIAASTARAVEDVARLGLRSARAQLRYDVASAYFDAVVAERSRQLAESSLVQTERTFRQASLQKRVGTVAEFDQLRAQVSRDAQRPLVIQATQQRDIAYIRLRQLLDLPLTQPIELVTAIQDAEMDRALAASRLDTEARPSAGAGLVGVTLDATPTLAQRDTQPEQRTAVRQAALSVQTQQAALTAARLERAPAFQLSTNYSRFAYQPNNNFLPNSFRDFFPNWTVTFGLSIPVWTSGRISGSIMQAEANVAEAKARLVQARDAAAVDVELALTSLRQAEATWLASEGTLTQAARALQIAEVRYGNGVSTQLEVDDVRNLALQAGINRLQAARDLQLARLRLSLLRDLPIGAGGGAVVAGSAQNTFNTGVGATVTTPSQTQRPGTGGAQGAGALGGRN
ncbi:MAG: TolC family protein [Gemmatimonadaceae bacterium]|nr:TolC family protein [Gemmatimonadaceae bacterium]